MVNNIAIQGYEGSFHQVAAWQFFGKNAGVITCANFKDVIKNAVSNKDCNAAVMAIENSIAGSILPNYNLLHKSNLSIVGEVYLQIKQNLLVNPGVKLEDIREVHSHSMALQQCFEYFDQHNWKLVESDDTALSAKHIHQNKSKHIAAVASKLAARLYNLDVIAPNIHTLKNNYTRFLILQREESVPELPEVNKASVSFTTDHSKGSLARVLTKIADSGINLSKLQSFPIPGSNWQYNFHADMEFEKLGDFEKAIKKITSITEHVKVYGVYKKGETY